MKQHFKKLASTGAMVFVTACGHAPQVTQPDVVDEAQNRERQILNANIEKVAVETATHKLLFDTNVMETYARYGVIYARSTCDPYVSTKATDFPNELKDTYSKVLDKLYDLDALEQVDLEVYKHANDRSIEKIQKNVREIRSYCELKFGL